MMIDHHPHLWETFERYKCSIRDCIYSSLFSRKLRMYMQWQVFWLVPFPTTFPSAVRRNSGLMRDQKVRNLQHRGMLRTFPTGVRITGFPFNPVPFFFRAGDQCMFKDRWCLKLFKTLFQNFGTVHDFCLKIKTQLSNAKQACPDNFVGIRHDMVGLLQ